jgi:predicted lysophospholipase L1 biosynthesis ABC-type transport system permease subunit
MTIEQIVGIVALAFLAITTVSIVVEQLVNHSREQAASREAERRRQAVNLAVAQLHHSDS